ncbi:MAG: hypothetical protein QOK40_3584, partial [Miltoncostaeaceae bacterium]|nr:hypothetical protein [Miltoncostaeaceae bacterium]
MGSTSPLLDLVGAHDEGGILQQALEDEPLVGL